MINYKSSMLSSKKYYEDDIPTAYKTNYQPNSPSQLQISTPKYRALSKYDNRINDAKNSINDMINQANYTNNANRDAIGKIRSVNSDAVKHYQQFAASTKSGSPKADHSNYSPQQTHIQSLNYQTDPQYNENNINPQMSTSTANNFNLYPNQNLNQNISLQDENIQLRKALNDQIKENNALLKRISFLEKQNEELRQALYHYSGGKINLRPTATFNRPEDFNESMQVPKTAKFRTHINSQNSYQNLNPQPNSNFRMNMNINGQNSPQNLAANYNSQRELSQKMFRDLQELKDQNEILRQNTINVLKNNC